MEPPPGLADQLGCDPGDRHVLAAAIAAKAEVIALDLAPGAIHGCLETIAARQRNPARTAQALLQILSRQAPTFASRCMEFQIDTN